MLRGTIELMAAAAQCAAAAPRSGQKAIALAQRLRWLATNRVPVEYLSRLIPGAVTLPPNVRMDFVHHFELPYGERCVLAAIATAVHPRVIFEFGTFTGSTTRLLADAAPMAVVHTIDLPDAELESEPWIAAVVGSAFSADPSYRGRILSHRCNAQTFDYEPFRGGCDLVFVDASHDYADVAHDSRRALEIMSEKGVVIWDDYQPGLNGVVQALNELHAEGLELARVAHTRLVIHCAGGFPVALPRSNPEPWADAPGYGWAVHPLLRHGGARSASESGSDIRGGGPTG